MRPIGNKHSYYVMETLSFLTFVCPLATASSAVWKTILVGGLNSGGRGYYALNITTPSPLLYYGNLTPMTEPNLGYTFGTPVMTKRPRW